MNRLDFVLAENLDKKELIIIHRLIRVRTEFGAQSNYKNGRQTRINIEKFNVNSFFFLVLAKENKIGVKLVLCFYFPFSRYHLSSSIIIDISRLMTINGIAFDTHITQKQSSYMECFILCYVGVVPASLHAHRYPRLSKNNCVASYLTLACIYINHFFCIIDLSAPLIVRVFN